MEQREKKKVTIYLPNIKESLSKELQTKEKAIRNILKDTPFEKDTNTIFEHLVKLHGALHYSEIEIQSHKDHLQIQKDIVNTILTFFNMPKDIEIICSGKIVCLPSIIVNETAMKIRESAIHLFNQTPSLFRGLDKNGNQIILDPRNKEHLEIKKQELEEKEKVLNKIKAHHGNATYTKDNPNKLTSKFRIVCAISIFVGCDGFDKWQVKAQRNRIIFECLQVCGYVENCSYLDANTQRSRVRDAEESDIIFVSPPL